MSQNIMAVIEGLHKNDDLTVYMSKNYPRAKKNKYFWKKVEIS